MQTAVKFYRKKINRRDFLWETNNSVFINFWKKEAKDSWGFWISKKLVKPSEYTLTNQVNIPTSFKEVQMVHLDENFKELERKNVPLTEAMEGLGFVLNESK